MFTLNKKKSYKFKKKFNSTGEKTKHEPFGDESISPTQTSLQHSHTLFNMSSLFYALIHAQGEFK